MHGMCPTEGTKIDDTIMALYYMHGKIIYSKK
jgi:hypothetical protein